jgi:beta-N-acetylhexosaminidase
MSAALEHMAAATLLASFAGPVVPEWLLRRVDDGLGGVCLFGSNLRSEIASPGSSADAGVRAAANVSGALHAVRSSVVVALDEEGGDVTRLEAHVGSSVPGNAALGAVDDPALTRRLAHALGLRLAEAGVDLDLAPCADANTDPANPVIGVRSFGADPALVARHVAAFVEGLQTAGIAACAKHFPGHGATTVDSHLDLPVVDAPVDVLRSRELVPFRAAITAGAATVMLGHLRMPAFDDQPATVSRRIAGLLRDEMGFRGAVVTDALDMEGIGGVRAIPANVVRAVAAGADLCCLGSEGTDELIAACIDALVAAVRHGDLDEARLADAAARVAAIGRHPAVAEPPDEQPLAELDAIGQPRPGRIAPNGPSDPSMASLGAEAARRALRIEVELPPIGPAHVVELRSVPNIAAGVVPWGVAIPLTALEPDTTSEELDPAGGAASSTDPVPRVLERAQGRRLVVVVRDWRRPATARLVAALVAARPDAVVVDMGWPFEIAAGGAGGHVSTYGASRASGEAVARLLAGRDAPASIAASTGRSPRG